MNKSPENEGELIPSLAHLFLNGSESGRIKRLQLYRECYQREEDFAEAVLKLSNPECSADGPTVAKALVSLWVMTHRLMGLGQTLHSSEGLLKVGKVEVSELSDICGLGGLKRSFDEADRNSTYRSALLAMAPDAAFRMPPAQKACRGRGVSVRGRGRGGAARPAKKMLIASAKEEKTQQLPEVVYDSDDE
jgi:hypothetical protein